MVIQSRMCTVPVTYDLDGDRKIHLEDGQAFFQMDLFNYETFINLDQVLALPKVW